MNLEQKRKLIFVTDRGILHRFVSKAAENLGIDLSIKTSSDLNKLSEGLEPIMLPAESATSIQTHSGLAGRDILVYGRSSQLENLDRNLRTIEFPFRQKSLESALRTLFPKPVSRMEPVIELPKLRKPRILVADDSPFMLNEYKKIFEKERYEIETEKDGRDAWEKLCKTTFDLVITDLVMKEMNGDELCRKIKKDGLLRTVPVLIVTGSQTEIGRIKEAYTSMGADGYLIKPAPSEADVNSEIIDEQRLEEFADDMRKKVRKLLRHIGVKRDEIIFFVDDSPTQRDLALNFLQNQGFTVVESESGEEALEQLQNAVKLPDLVISDHNLSDDRGKLNGADLLLKMHQDAKLCDVPTLLISSDADDVVRRLATDVGAKGFLSRNEKENFFDNLLLVVELILERYALKIRYANGP